MWKKDKYYFEMMINGNKVDAGIVEKIKNMDIPNCWVQRPTPKRYGRECKYCGEEGKSGSGGYNSPVICFDCSKKHPCESCGKGPDDTLDIEHINGDCCDACNHPWLLCKYCRIKHHKCELCEMREWNSDSRIGMTGWYGAVQLCENCHASIIQIIRNMPNVIKGLNFDVGKMLQDGIKKQNKTQK